MDRHGYFPLVSPATTNYKFPAQTLKSDYVKMMWTTSTLRRHKLLIVLIIIIILHYGRGGRRDYGRFFLFLFFTLYSSNPSKNESSRFARELRIGPLRATLFTTRATPVRAQRVRESRTRTNYLTCTGFSVTVIIIQVKVFEFSTKLCVRVRFSPATMHPGWWGTTAPAARSSLMFLEDDENTNANAT